MGNAISDASAGRAYAEACARMHTLHPNCEEEFRDLSEAVNAHGRSSAVCTAAAAKLRACNLRRDARFDAMTARCGPAQEAFRVCAQRAKEAGHHEATCLPVLHSFLDCAERALADLPPKERVV